MAKDYSDIGLDARFRPENSPIAPTGNLLSIYNLAQSVFNELNPNTEAKTAIDGIFFKHAGTIPFETYYVAGQITSTTTAMTSVAAARHRIRAFPFLSTRGGVIDRIAANVTVGTPSGVFRMGIYQATSQTNIYPEKLLVDSGEISSSTTGVKMGTINLYLRPNTLYWFSHIAGGTADASFTNFDTDDNFSILGVGTSFTVAYSHFITPSYTYGSLPATFPDNAGAPTINVGLAIGVRFLT